MDTRALLGCRVSACVKTLDVKYSSRAADKANDSVTDKRQVAAYYNFAGFHHEVTGVGGNLEERILKEILDKLKFCVVTA